MISIPLLILFCLEAVACIVGFLNWRSIKGTYFKWFPVFLLYTFIADLLGPVLYFSGVKINNDSYYDHFVIPVEFNFFFWLFYMTFRRSQQQKNKRLPIVCVGVYLISLLVEALHFTKRIYPFYSFSYTIGNLLLLVLILSFFIQMLISNAILSFRSNMMFWVCTGLLIFYLGTCPYYGLRNTFVYRYPTINIIYTYIVLVLDCLMYLMFTFSFIWGKPNSKSLSSWLR